MMPPPALVGLAHGSRDPSAARAIGDVMAAVASARPDLPVAAAFLDLSEPDLVTALRAVGASRAVAVPLLFSRAFHARIDAPEAAAAAQQDTGVQIRLGDILGMGDGVLDGLDSSANEAGIGSTHEILLLAVGSSDTSANSAVAALADRWAARRNAPVTAVFATCEPKATPALESAVAAGRQVAVVPLFLAPGLLLNVVRKSADRLGVPVAAPLGTLLAGLVLERYDQAVADWV